MSVSSQTNAMAFDHMVILVSLDTSLDDINGLLGPQKRQKSWWKGQKTGRIV